MSTEPVITPAEQPRWVGQPVPHTLVEDLLGLVTGIFTVSLGLALLEAAGAVTGGTAGLSLLLTYASGVSFQVLFVVVNLPFFALALWQKGWVFTLKSLVSVVAASACVGLHQTYAHLVHVEQVYGVLAGNLLTGLGVLFLFRHASSVGGFSALVLIVQEKLGWPAGYVQMALDVLVVVSAFAVVPPEDVLLSAVGAAVLNAVLVLNHKPGRYMGC